MPLEPVHVMEFDRATSRLELTRINPTRSFMTVALKEDGHWAGTPASYTYQNGTWYDTGGNQIADPEREVPAQFRQEIADNPMVAGLAAGPSVTAVCKFCAERMNSSEMEQHLIAHVTQTMAEAGRTTSPAPESSTPPVDKRDANRHAKG